MILRTAGEVVEVSSTTGWASALIAAAAGVGSDAPPSDDATPSVRLRVETGNEGFDRVGMRPVTRGAYSDGRRTVLLDAGGSGFDLLVTVGDHLDVCARYRPRPATRAANRALRGRFALLAGQVLVHYPVLWRAGWRGRVPLHASVAVTRAGTPLLAGPGGVGKSTVMAAALADGARATADNLCCTDGVECFGVAEPLRLDAGVVAGRRTSHGRVEQPFAGRVEALAPDRLVVLERGRRSEFAPIDPADAARVMVAGTYAAGELRRYWAFAATLALATGRGPAHPPIAATAAALAGRLPCARVRVGDGESISAEQLYQVEGGRANG